ncbi:type I 3-dehydroquinate dehydratase [Candidatus Haliotispira prima]|uniref:shikimate dehydrogenase (NADP(+)) n=1 Tax=Candidatus Haliotispira prima TaxID=3034016 RepID=A0ABY8MJV8_9SPIO|nr:type I 3-dehydroquinate dehydratase [Candidatus Haliotispira prima]
MDITAGPQTPSEPNRICLCLNGTSFAENLAILRAEKYFNPSIDLAELRLDFLPDFSDSATIQNTPEQLCRDFSLLSQQTSAWAPVRENTTAPTQFVLTLRKAADGGRCPDSIPDTEYLRLLLCCVESFPPEHLAYVDLDGPILERVNSGPPELRKLCVKLLSRMQQQSAQLIVSIHDFGPLPGMHTAPTASTDENESIAEPINTQLSTQLILKLMAKLEQLLTTLPKTLGISGETKAIFESALPKLALMVSGSKELRSFYRSAHKLKARYQNQAQPRPFILLAMGEFGSSSRILGVCLGNKWTFCSPSNPNSSNPDSGRNFAPVAPGQFSFAELIELYNYRNLSPQTQIYGVVGDPIAHSRSPEIHNPIYRQRGWDAVYLRFRVDNLADFLALGELLPIRGISCTVPHKETLAQLALKGMAMTMPIGLPPSTSRAGQSVKLLGAGNTFCPSEDGSCWLAENTDIEGFLRPLLKLCTRHQITLQGKKAVIIGAGGSARAVVYALLGQGMRCEIYNRTLQKAEELEVLFSAVANLPGKVTKAATLEHGVHIPEDCDLLVQTTSVGMYKADQDTKGQLLDPVTEYRFRSDQIAYDLIYQPPETVFLKRAKDAGALVLNGSAMLKEQALAQIELFGRQQQQENK